jgi:hypothetical protein
MTHVLSRCFCVISFVAVLVATPAMSCAREPQHGALVQTSSTEPDTSDVVAASSRPPPFERACNADVDCAVAHIEVSGEQVCCPACGTTPGTKHWHAELQRFCGSRSQTTCGPLAWPSGPTLAVCKDHVCEATAYGGHAN